MARYIGVGTCIVSGFLFVGCSGAASDTTTGVGGGSSTIGGSSTLGGTTSGAQNGGAKSTGGGSSNGSGGARANGGATTSTGSTLSGGAPDTGSSFSRGGNATSGGQASSTTGGTSKGGSAAGGTTSKGGAMGTGGSGTGGATAKGGSTNAGGSPMGGSASGGSPAAGGGVSIGGTVAAGGAGAAGGSSSNATFIRPRVIDTTDLLADPDDEQSLVRQLVYADWFDLEGLVVTTSCWKKTQGADGKARLDRIVNAYGQVVSNLKVHDPDFPSVEYVKSISVMGQTGYSMGDVGAGKDSAGSNLIISAVDKADPRPVWVTCWGGCNTVAQAIWKVQNSRTAAELKAFVKKLRVYDVLGQDEAGAWLTHTFPEDLLFIRARNLVYNWQPTETWVNDNVQNHGALGAVYPEKIWAYEGDTPAFLHLIPNGLHDPSVPDQGGWGGRFGPQESCGVGAMDPVSGQGTYNPYCMYTDASEGGGSISRWKSAIENDFAARMDWSTKSQYSEANHHPIAIVNNDTTRNVLTISAAAGENVALSAAGSKDPDGDSLSYSWSFYDEPSSHNGAVTIQGVTSASATVAIPSGTSGKNLHVILTLSDNGTPNLTAYRRVIVNVQ